MKIEPLSVTYARSLMELAEQSKKLRPILEEIRFVGGLFRENPEFRVFVESPKIPLRVKRETIDRAFKGKLDDVVVNFLQIVVQKKRQQLLGEIFAECELLYDASVGRIHVDATTAVPLGDDRKKDLGTLLSRKLKKDVVLVNTVRPEILGGLVLRYGDLVADDSVKSALDKVAGRMKAHKLGSELVHES